MIIEVKGVQFQNLGAQLMLFAVLESLRDRKEQPKIAVRLGQNTNRKNLSDHGLLRKQPMRRDRLDLNELTYLLPRRLHQAPAAAIGVTEAGIDAILDASGFAYGDRWGNGALHSAASELKRFEKYKKPYVFLPQAFGPFDITRLAALEFGEMLDKNPFVYARDSVSATAIQGILPRKRKIAVIPDISLGVKGDHSAAAKLRIDKRNALIVPNIRLTEKIGFSNYFLLLKNAIRVFQYHGFSVALLNHGGLEDEPLIKSVTSLPDFFNIKIIQPEDARSAKGVIGSSGIVLSSRFHACVSALSSGVPCLSIGWSHKYTELFNSFDCGAFSLTQNQLDKVSETVEQVLKQSADITPRLIEITAGMQLQLKGFWNEIFDGLNLSPK
jgi:polysaccharide pyruvyl transferase WcaK-like protein